MTQQQLWATAHAAWSAALGEENVYDRDIWLPAHNEGALTDAMDAEIERLQERRWTAEDALLAIPAVNAQQLATKVLMAFDNGREGGGFVPQLLTDSRRFADSSLTHGDLSPDNVASSLSDAGHRGWMREHVAALEEGVADQSEEPPAFRRAATMAEIVLSTPAVTDDDVISRMVMLTMEVAAGGCASTDHARSILREAIAHFGIGSTADFEGVRS
ncbi:MAG: hypothetical protein PGN16_08525 [Sphingomonas phyllosphaerae]|uniref:hypothetical protein n=1 Tax=Sphingomonas phyllosphaerae TaxID=257003 RepID=UPI002FFB9D5F